MNYQKIHDAIIERAKTRTLEGYGEKHHIHPKAFGGSNAKSNLVKLTAREHFIIHHLLWRIHGDGPMGYAFSMMVNGGSKKDYKITSKHYESARIANSASLKGNNYNLGKKHSPETKQKISDANKGRKGRKRSPETKQKISDANKGRKRSPETKQKISDANKGRKRSPETKQKISDANKGRKHTTESKQKMSDANKGNKYCLGRNYSKETIQKMSDVKMGKVLTEEHKRKISEGVKKKKPTMFP